MRHTSTLLALGWRVNATRSPWVQSHWLSGWTWVHRDLIKCKRPITSITCLRGITLGASTLRSLRFGSRHPYIRAGAQVVSVDGPGGPSPPLRPDHVDRLVRGSLRYNNKRLGDPVWGKLTPVPPPEVSEKNSFSRQQWKCPRPTIVAALVPPLPLLGPSSHLLVGLSQPLVVPLDPSIYRSSVLGQSNIQAHIYRHASVPPKHNIERSKTGAAVRGIIIGLY